MFTFLKNKSLQVIFYIKVVTETAESVHCLGIIFHMICKLLFVDISREVSFDFENSRYTGEKEKVEEGLNLCKTKKTQRSTKRWGTYLAKLSSGDLA